MVNSYNADVIHGYESIAYMKLAASVGWTALNNTSCNGEGCVTKIRIT